MNHEFVSEPEAPIPPAQMPSVHPDTPRPEVLPTWTPHDHTDPDAPRPAVGEHRISEHVPQADD